MKYWVYKESRILGPFDKEAMSGFPGLDSGTLVCADDPAGGSWIPAGELDGLMRTVGGSAGAGLLDDFPSSIGLLDQLQIDSAGLVGDDEFPGALAEDLFQDASFKKGFGDALSARAPADEAAARRAHDRIFELSAQLEAMASHIAKLEAGQTELTRRLAVQDLELRARGGAGSPPGADVRQGGEKPPELPSQLDAVSRRLLELEAGQTDLVRRIAAQDLELRARAEAAPPPAAPAPAPVAAAIEAMPSPAEWPETAPSAGVPEFPSFPEEKPVPSAAIMPKNPAPPLPDIPVFSLAAPSEAPPLAELEALPEPPAAAEVVSFGRPKPFKIVPTVKSFKVPGADEPSPGAVRNPVPEFKFEPIIEAPAPIPIVDAPIPAPQAPPVVPDVVVLAEPPPPAPAFAPISTPSFAPASSFTLPAYPQLGTELPADPPPNTLNRSQPAPDFASGDLVESAQAPVEAAGTRFAKPEPASPMAETKKAGRSNKVFLAGGGVLVTLLVILGVIFMRQPKEDLKQMTTFDDGKAPIGLSADDGLVAAPPIVKPKIDETPAAPAPPPGPSAEHTAAIALVKDFPLDGGRGTVGRWLQYSYTASPDAGAEEWNASVTGENAVLVEYRLVPGASGGKGALYLFEVDANEIVIGKNIEARQMLAGGPPSEAPKARKKPAKKAAPRRRAVREAPKDVPLLPLPDSGELRPPAEDDGTFGTDIVNPGI